MSTETQSAISFFAASNAPSAFSLFSHPQDHHAAYENARLVWPSAIYTFSKTSPSPSLRSSPYPSDTEDEEEQGSSVLSSFLTKLNKILRNKIVAAI
ncbi:hypothetical protein Clacol_000297 [Clathrus columnatus]|uniref:Uncharacterized protein n=1 Tax=Clathrus columnatus TaxID=1419009 RepID=A0AAV4ZY83_9AGAM|nr:hypothetical protein Clacol_000297 [Clathrus columnatus]